MAVPTGALPSKINKRFPYDFSWGFTGGPSFFTALATGSSGFEQRNVNWEVARHKYQADHQVKTQEELDELRAFFMAVRGMGVGFRFFDWADYSTDMENQIGTTPLFSLGVSGDMTPQDMRCIDTGAVGIGDGSERDFQILKTYCPEPIVGDLVLAVGATLQFNDLDPDTIVRSAGSFETDGFLAGQYLYCWGASGTLNGPGYLGQIAAGGVAAATLTLTTASTLTTEAAVGAVRLIGQTEQVSPYIREIKAPIAVRCFKGGTPTVEGAGHTTDFETGLVNFAVAPLDNEIVQCDAIYDVWARLASDDLMAQLSAFNVGDWASIELTEIRE